MKLLLDENIPVKFKTNLPDFEVFTVHECEWNGKKNGELLELILNAEFEALITADKNLQSQQNLKKYPIPVLVLNVKRLTYQNIIKLLPKLKKTLKTDLGAGSHVISES